MSDPLNDKFLDDNLSRLLDGDIDTPQLSSESEARMFEQLKRKQVELFEQPKVGSSERQVGISVPEVQETLPSKHAVRAQKETPMQSATTIPQPRSWTFAVVACVVVASFFGLMLLFDIPRTTNGPSRFGLGHKSKTNLDSREVTRKTLDDGTIIIADRGSKYSIVSTREISLEQGDIYLIVARSGKPFVVKTSEGEIRATGTRFTVSANEQTSAAVAQGQVSLVTDQATVELVAGERGFMRRGERPTREPAPRLSHLVSWAKEALAQKTPLVEKAEAKDGLIALDPWGQETRLTLRKYHIDVYIEDGIARTTIDQTFFNHYPWNSEGTFYFPLPPDASVSRLAMYVAGHLNEGGMVERGYGQQIFSEIRYQNRDPALLEMMEGNVFKMRIFPLEGRQEKRVFLSYTQKLPELYGTMRYWFPMEHTHNRTKQLSIRVRIKDAAKTYKPLSSTHKTDVQIDGDDLVLQYRAKNVKPDQDFLLQLVPRDDQQQTRIATFENAGFKYVFGRFTPKLRGDVDTKPRQWIVLNDVSGSRSQIDAQAQRYILKRLIQEADDQDTIFLVNLNTRARLVSTEFSSVRSGDADRLTRDPKLAHLGATNFAEGLKAVANIIEKHKPKNPHVLYLGDGTATDGQTEIESLVAAIPKSATFIGIGVGKKVDARLLQAAADATGGAFTTINPDEDIDWRIFDLIAALNTPRLTGLTVRLEDGRGGAVDAIAYPSARSLSAGETLSVVARCAEFWPTSIVIQGKLGSEDFERRYRLEDVNKNAEFIPRFWAKQHIDRLLRTGTKFKDEIINLSKQYYVVTPFTSLIVLEDDKMYKQYKVERGRKDHWALYPAPKEIDVVREPTDWNRRSWWGAAPVGKDAKIKAKAKPRSVQEIVDSVQFRINAPFYYWRPQSRGSGRDALYRLVDSNSDPTRLLTSLFLKVAGVQSTSGSGSNATSTAMHKGRESSRRKLNRELAQTFRIRPLVLPATAVFQLIDGRDSAFDISEADDSKLLAGNFLLPSMMMDARRIVADLPSVTGQTASFGRPEAIFGRRSELHRKGDGWLMATSLLSNSSTLGNRGPFGSVPPKLAQSFDLALARRWTRINKDIQGYNRQYGYWDGDFGIWNSNSIDLTKSVDSHWYGGLEGLVSEIKSDEFIGEFESVVDYAMMSSSGRLVTRSWINVFDRISKNQPGTCAVLAVDHLVARKKQLQEKLLTPKSKRELASIKDALESVGSASAKLEDSGRFWGQQGWNYRPQTWTFQPPTVQARMNYNWSFDLTRYTPGLYSNSVDILNEVVREYPSKSEGKVSNTAREKIEQARKAIRPSKIRYAKGGQEMWVASGDRFATTRYTDMSLEETIVCNGTSILHCYEELGLAARRPASELNLASLRRFAPHLIEPAEVLAQQFDVQHAGDTDDGFLLTLTSTTQDNAESQYCVTIEVGNDGRIRQKTLTMDDKQRLMLTFEYKGSDVIARWFDKRKDKQLSEAKYIVEPLETDVATFDVDLASYVVFDMPLRKPSFYAQHLEKLGDDDIDEKIRLKRHHALALIQELHWRRWGQTNSKAVKSLTDAFQLMKQLGQSAKRGDVVLFGSSGRHDATEIIKKYTAGDDSEALSKFFRLRYRKADAFELRDKHPKTLVGHMAAYRAAVNQMKITEHYREFIEQYPDSPLLLAATYHCANWGQNPDAWTNLYDHPRWRAVAMMMSAARLKTDEQRSKLETAFKQMYEQLAKAGYDTPITAPIANQLKKVNDGKVWKGIVQDRFDKAKKLKRMGPLLQFAEDATSWGETQLADLAFEQAHDYLENDNSLLRRFALGQSLWTSNRFQDAFELYEKILDRLEEDNVAASPALLAAAARLAEQAGKHGRAIDLEEQALEIEHEHLPKLINVQAFRQRYAWLWQQYQAKIQSAVSNKDEADIEKWMARAVATWQRWYEIDRNNHQMVHQMATLQTLAGRDDEAWLYLSTIIDKRPRDAQSYYAIGKWYSAQSQLDQTEQWYARAYTWDTSNPRWLYERGLVLIQLDRREDAYAVFQQVIDGKWASGLQRYVRSAKQAIQK